MLEEKGRKASGRWMRKGEKNDLIRSLLVYGWFSDCFGQWRECQEYGRLLS
jgi:hypothetical protein